MAKLPKVTVTIKSDWQTGIPKLSGDYVVCRVPEAGYLFRYKQLAMFGDLMGVLPNKIFYIGNPGKKDFENITDSVIAWIPIVDYRKEDI